MYQTLWFTAFAHTVLQPYFFHMLDWMFTKLGQKHVWVYGYKTYGSKNSPGIIWGHKGQKR